MDSNPNPYNGRPLKEGEYIARCWFTDRRRRMLSHEIVVTVETIAAARAKYIRLDLPKGCPL